MLDLLIALGTASAAPPTNEALRAEAHDQLAARWPHETAPVIAPRLQVELDALVARVAVGKVPLNEVHVKIAQIFSFRDVVEGEARTWAVALPPGHDLDTAEVPLENWSRHVAVGTCRGRLGERRGPIYDLVLVVVAETAR